MPGFLDIRFPTTISYGSQGGPEYSTAIAGTASGYENRQINWAMARHKYNAVYGTRTQEELESVIALFHVVRGKGYSFAFKDWADYKSCGVMGTPTAADQNIGTGNGVLTAFQLVKNYIYGSLSFARNITKPVVGTVLIAIQAIADTRWTLGTNNGIVTFSADITKSINAITQAAQGKITFTAAHTLSVGSTFHVSGVSGMTQINTKRVTVLALDSSTQVTTNLNTSAYSAYTSGGTIHTIPQASEAVTAGYEFDVPVRFDTDHLDISLESWMIGSANIPLIEDR